MINPANPEARSLGALDIRRILGAAVQLIDRDGLEAFTMRRLGQHLGVEAMALYHHIPSREALLDGVIEVVIDQLPVSPDVLSAAGDWRRYLAQLAQAVRRIALAHPELFPLIATRPASAPWIRPPLRSLQWTEAFLGALRNFGFTDRAAVKVYQSFSSFLLGHLLLEVAGRGAVVDPPSDHDASPSNHAEPAAGPVTFPTTLDPTAEPSAADFAEALKELLIRLDVADPR